MSLLPAPTPKISVIIPNYNHCNFLKQRFSSVFEQTLQDYEIIFLDDKSSDCSLDIFSAFSNHPRIAKALFNTTNSGSPYIQWNRGILEARGEYIWIAESDDYAHPEFLERMTHVLDSNPDVGIAFCRSIMVDESSVAVGSTDEWLAELGSERWSKDFIAQGKTECGPFLFRKCMIPNVSSALIRKKTLIAAGYAHERMRYCGDYFTYAKLLEISDLAYIATALNYFRFSRNTVRSKMHHSWLHEYEKATVMAYVSDNFPISAEERKQATANYLEGQLRLIAYDTHYAIEWLKGYRKYRNIAKKFCPNLELRMFSKALAIAGRLASKRILARRGN